MSGLGAGGAAPWSTERIESLAALGRWEQALGEATALAGAVPSARNLTLLATCALQCRQTAVARDAAQRAVAADPGDAHALMVLAQATQGTLGGLVLGRPVAIARRALALDPNEPWLLESMGDMLAIRGSAVRAGALYRRALELDPGAVQVWRAAARIPLARAQLGQAQQIQEHALRLDPVDPQTIADLAFTLALRGKIDEAFELHRRSIASAPEEATLIHLAGRSANGRTVYPAVAAVSFVVGVALLGIFGIVVMLAATRLLTVVDDRRVSRGRHPLGMASDLRAMPGIGRAVVAYRKGRGRGRSVGPTVGWGIPRFAAVGAGAAFLGVVLSMEGGSPGTGLMIGGLGVAFAAVGIVRCVRARRVASGLLSTL